MDNLDWLGLRVYYNGEFEESGKCLTYHGGSVEVTFIQRDNVSLASVREQIADIKMAYHGESLTDNHRLYWLYPGMNVRDGLRRLETDANVYFMERCITDGGVVDIYVNLETEGGEEPDEGNEEEQQENTENPVSESQEEHTDSDWQAEHEEDLDDCSDEAVDEHEHEHAVDEHEHEDAAGTAANVKHQGGEEINAENKEEVAADECEDLDWCPGDADSSGEDDEAEDLRKHAKEVLRKIRMNLPLDEEKEIKENTAQLILVDEMMREMTLLTWIPVRSTVMMRMSLEIPLGGKQDFQDLIARLQFLSFPLA